MENRNNKRAEIVKFINEISQKNYAQANKYLRNAIEDKMKDRLKVTARKIGF